MSAVVVITVRMGDVSATVGVGVGGRIGVWVLVELGVSGELLASGLVLDLTLPCAPDDMLLMRAGLLPGACGEALSQSFGVICVDVQNLAEVYDAPKSK